MENNELWKILLPISAGLVIGVIGYFLKSAFSRVDKLEHGLHGNEIVTHEIKKDYVTQATHQKAIDELREQLKDVERNYITKEDFFREQSKTDGKLDKIFDLLLEMKGGREHE